MSRAERVEPAAGQELALSTQEGGNGAARVDPRHRKGHRGGYRRPEDAPPHGQANCRRCGLTWTGLAEAHCSGCCSHFSTTGVFDTHLRANGCIRPEDLRVTRGPRKGQPLLEAFERDGRTVWRTYVDPDKPPPSHWRGKQ